MTAAAKTETPTVPEKPLRDFRQEVTDQIVGMLEKGVAPWQKPWEPGDPAIGKPINPTTERPYRGGNAVHLLATALQRGYDDPRWMTYNQAAKEGWQVKRGEKGTQIEYWEASAKRGDEKSRGSETDGVTKSKNDGPRFLHRVYTVFNAQQIEGVPPLAPKTHSAFEAVRAGEEILKNSGVAVHHDQGDRAFYKRSTDSIHLPPKEQFKDAAAYYGTALHELAHATGHPSRLNRATLNESYRFGDTNYAKEELRAELASVFLAAERGIPHDPQQHAAYVGSWIKVLKEDKHEIFRAAHDANAAADFLLALERDRSRAEQTLATGAEASAVSGSSKAAVLEDQTTELNRQRDGAEENHSPESTVVSSDTREEIDPWESTSHVARAEPDSGTVSVENKETGTNRHMPAPSAPSPHPTNGSSTQSEDKLREAQTIATEALGKSVKIQLPEREGGIYSGPIVGVTDTYTIQRLSAKAAIAHPNEFLESQPQIGANISVNYSNKLAATVRVIPERSISRDRNLSR